MVLTFRRRVRARGVGGEAGAAALAVALLVACRCGGGPAADDSGPEDGGLDDRVADVLPDADAGEGDGTAGDVADVEDVEGLDVRDVVEAVPCDVSERDVPVWERAVGECWHDDPPARDLSAEWFEPEPGCEQITYGNYRIFNGWPASYDVWGDAVAFVNRGIFVVDVAAKTERNIEPFVFDEPSYTYPTDFVAAHMGALTPRYVAYEGTHQHAGRGGEAPADGCYILVWDRRERMKRLAYSAACPFGDFTGQFPVDDLHETTVIGPLYLTTEITQQNVHTLDVETLENVAVTAFPFGEGFWDSRLWADTAVLSVRGRALILADLAARTTRPLDLGTGDEWRPAIHERRVCWLKGDSSMAHGDHVDCMDLDESVPWRASDDPDSFKEWPTVFGEWVAWEDVWESSPGAWDETVAFYRRDRDLRFRLSDRTTWFSGDAKTVRLPRLWGNHVYFLVWDRAALTGLIFRCNLRTLFPEVYE